ncbi:hypothetical protein C0Q70_09297 [Pomacea canaliculata]|uniref:Protein-lysine N-trimethyltransferase SMYD5 n=2 Tax=Pomacea canaliculata TaxID=400727 RepID=A0A2T7P9F4_POMCA|nr:hypothetical protein C0Q70_09297 [Pomacea canaliculata]
MAVSAAVPAGVEIRQADVRKGKGLFATTSFREGDVILTETPLVSAQFCWNELYKYKACEFCLRSLETAEEMSQRLTENPALTLPHPECCAVDPSVFSLCPQCQVLYCSEACRTEAWNRYHRVLCMGPSRTDGKHPLLQLQETWRNIHYPPETSSIMLLVKMAAMVRQSPDPKRMVDRFSKFVHTTVNEEEEIMHKLLGKEFQGQLEVLRSLAAECLYHEDIQQWLTPEGFQSVFALIGTNGQGIGSSSISKWVKNCESLVLSSEEKEQLDAFIDQLYIDLDQVSGAFLNCEGSGLYELQSACNHSCVPNAEISFLHGNHTLTLSCARDIEQGEEIFISYLDECDVDRSRHSRQKILRENYLFICTCPKCLEQAGDIDETSEEEMSEGEEGDMGD